MGDAEKLYIEIDLGNEAMQTARDADYAISRALHTHVTWSDPLEPHQGGAIRDANGNTVGSWRVD